MGALTLGNVGPSVYGAVRGVQDYDADQRTKQAFDTDQAIRRERLDQDKQEAPMRRRALQLGIEDAEHRQQRRGAIESREDTLAGLNIDLSKLSLEEKTALVDDLRQAREKQKVLRDGLSRFQASADPGEVVKSLQQIYPQFKGATAVRNDDGSISALKPDGSVFREFKGKRWEDGSVMTPDDEFSIFAYDAMDPVKSIEARVGQDRKVQIEREKTDRALGVAGINADSRQGAINGRRSEAWYSRQHQQIRPVLDSMLKTQGVAGSFIAGYAHENDAALRGLIEERVEKSIEDGVPVRQAANQTINDVRAGYDLLDKKARQHAAALAKAKIKPNDMAAVQEAAKGGNADAVELLKTLKVAEKNLGPSVAKYLQSQIPAK